MSLSGERGASAIKRFVQQSHDKAVHGMNQSFGRVMERQIQKALSEGKLRGLEGPLKPKEPQLRYN